MFRHCRMGHGQTTIRIWRFDADSVEVDDLSMFAVGEVITVTEKRSGVQVEAWFEENWIEAPDGYDDEVGEASWRLDAFAAVYRQLIEGDYRGLFFHTRAAEPGQAAPDNPVREKREL
jgi:hypothetical protein